MLTNDSSNYNTRFNSSEYWESRYARGETSGAGSYNILAGFKAEILNEFIEANSVFSVVEWGCGDGNQLSYMKYHEYCGLDVSPSAIELCKSRFADDDTKSFVLTNGIHRLDKMYDLAISLDVIFHLIEDEVYSQYMINLFSSSDKYVCIYSSNNNVPSSSIHVKHRCFNEFVKDTFTDFELINYIPNRYPWDDKNPNNTSFSDFYFYQKRKEEDIG